MNLKAFGQALRDLRKRRGLTQNKLARQLHLSVELISIWERAYQHQGRRWKPDRSAVMSLVELFADQLSPKEAQTWAAQVDYQLGQAELQKIFPGYSMQDLIHFTIPPDFQTNLKRLKLPPAPHLFGLSAEQARLRFSLEQAEAPWLIAIDGMGGIGKTALANTLVQTVMATDRFYDLAWVSAKQEEFLPGTGLRRLDQPALDRATLMDALLEQLDPNLPPARSMQEKMALLTSLLNERPYLIVIDNLETVLDYQTLVPLLRQLVGPSKFLLTSRHTLRSYIDVFCLTIKGLSRPDTIAFVRHEAEMRGIPVLLEASDTHLERIYEVVGGNPLALKLVVGQIGILPLSQVLENLKQARGKRIEELYTYIYWQAWQALDPASQIVLLCMPLAQGGNLEQLLSLSKLEIGTLNQALENLISLSLVEARGDIEQRSYHIHRLTETFLLNEVVKWGTTTD